MAHQRFGFEGGGSQLRNNEGPCPLLSRVGAMRDRRRLEQTAIFPTTRVGRSAQPVTPCGRAPCAVRRLFLSFPAIRSVGCSVEETLEACLQREIAPTASGGFTSMLQGFT